MLHETLKWGSWEPTTNTKYRVSGATQTLKWEFRGYKEETKTNFWSYHIGKLFPLVWIGL